MNNISNMPMFFLVSVFFSHPAENLDTLRKIMAKNAKNCYCHTLSLALFIRLCISRFHVRAWNGLSYVI